MPFGLFVGVNNHFQSIMLGGAFMCHEAGETFEWVFSEFLSLMDKKHPVNIPTDSFQACYVYVLLFHNYRITI